VIQTNLQVAVGLHQRGRFLEAEKLYQNILKSEPDHFDALHLLGTLLHQTGKTQHGVELIRRAIAVNSEIAAAYSNLGAGLLELGNLDEALVSFDKAISLIPDYADAHFNRGLVLKGLARLPEAIDSYDRAIVLKPNYAEAYFNRGTVLHNLKQLDEALASYGKAIALKPDYAEAYSTRGNVLYDLKRFDEALASCDKSIALRPGSAAAYSNRGLVLAELKRWQEAIASYDEAIALKPDYAEAYSNLGIALKEVKRFDEAAASNDQAIALKPDYAEAYSNRGIVLHHLNRLADALVSCDRAIALKPDYAAAYSNLGIVLKELMRLDEAIASYDKALTLKPDSAETHFNRSHCLLLLGNLEEGWTEYEWRKQTADWDRQALSCPPWVGAQDIRGKSMIITAEQGLGDTLQFCRYLRFLEEKGARIIFAVQRQLSSLVKTLSPTIEVVALGEALPAADYQCSLLSLPLAFGTRLDGIPTVVPYLSADLERVERWKRRIGDEGFKVGIAWQGRLVAADAGRSFEVSNFADIGRTANVRLISLQKEHGSEQLQHLPEGMKVETLGDDYDTGLEAFLDTAAVMASLDLVITSDTAIGHLAGALGRPTWVALRQVPDWRWLLNRSDSPWYPTLRLFRQPARGDWSSVFRAMQSELAKMTSREESSLPLHSETRGN
jgi:tetratricopeptide (TPR) repeat protein